MRRFSLSRRTLLRGAGAAIGLPWLEAMAAPASQDKPPVRMAALYMPNGVHPDKWTPTGEKRDFKLSQTLSPLADLQDQLLVLTNLWNPGSVGGDGHYVKISGWLTCTTVTKTLGVDVSANGTSMDQLAVQKAGRQTPIPSLELGIAPVTTGVDRNVGYTRVYGSHIAWANATTPLAREINPRSVYERLFRAASGQSNNAAKMDTLLLDRVLGDALFDDEFAGKNARDTAVWKSFDAVLPEGEAWADRVAAGTRARVHRFAVGDAARSRDAVAQEGHGVAIVQGKVRSLEGRRGGQRCGDEGEELHGGDRVVGSGGKWATGAGTRLRFERSDAT